MTTLKVGIDFKNPVSKTVSKGETIESLTPEPKSTYTAVYNRTVLSNTFVVSNLPANSRIDFVTINPPLVNISNAAPITINSSNVFAFGEKKLKYYTLSDGKHYVYDQRVGQYFKINLSSNNLAIISDQLFPIPNSNIFDWSPSEPDSIFVPDPLVTEPIRTFATGAAIGLAAVGPQETLLYEKHTDWTPNLVQHTNFSIFQKVLNLTSGPFIGNTVTCQINPGECGDLIGPMYLKCNLPPNITYTDRVGVALLNKCEIYFDNILIDFYDSDWHTIYNDIFLSADEILALEPLIMGPNLLVPLRFFFCGEIKHYLPICALKYQKIYIKLYFNKQSWFTGYTDSNLELSDVSLVYDTVYLTREEKLYYMNNKITFDIPRYYREVPTTFSSGYVNMNITANFKVSMMIWFIRNLAEYLNDYRKRYSYGYVTSLVRSYNQYVDWRGDTKYYERTFDDLQIFVNNYNIVSGISNDLYYAFKGAIDHGLSVPDKNIFMYCFGDKVNSETNNGYIDFSKYPSKTTSIVINFRKDLVTELVEKFELYIYYYGIATLTFSGGYGTVKSVQ